VGAPRCARVVGIVERVLREEAAEISRLAAVRIS
jgi:hypothetical protein